MREVRTKIIIGALLVTLVIPGVLFLRPQKAEAIVSLVQCITAKTTSGSIAATSASTAAIASVSTSDIPGTVASAVAPAGSDWASCFMKGFAIILGKAMLHTFTQSVIGWINSGFEGSPSFVTNPEGFLNNVADQAIGEVIEGISPLLCAPFRINLRFSLGLNLSLNSKESIHCKLSDVLANVRGAYDGFVGGAIGSGNLSQWIHIAGTPQNNPYGAYIATTNKLSLGITSATGKEIKLLDWGKGFKSWKDCEKYGPDVVVKKNGATLLQSDEFTPITRKGPCIKEGPIKTPGSIIEGQTTGALNSTFRELELANEIDAVVGALINQMLKQVMAAGGGLLGAKKDSSGSGGSSIQALLAGQDDVLKNTDAVAPDGINCSLHYYPATKETTLGSKVYVPDDSNNQVWTDNLSFAKLETTDKRKVVEAKKTNGALITKPPEKSWTVYFKEVKVGCSNINAQLTQKYSTEQIGKYYPGQSGSVGDTKNLPGPVAPAVEKGNIALNKFADQSSIHENAAQKYGPQNLVNGNIFGDSYGGGAFAAGYTRGQSWFQIDLNTYGETGYGGFNGSNKGTVTDTEISEIKIFRMSGDWYSRYDGYEKNHPFRLYVTTTDTKLLSQVQLDRSPMDQTVLHRGSYYLEAKDGKIDLLHEINIETTTDVLKGSIKFNPPIKGRYVYILQDKNHIDSYFGFAEVQVIGKQTRLQAEGGGSGTVAPPVFAFTVIPTSPTNVEIRSGETFLWPGISFLPNKAQDNITFRALFYTYYKEDPATSVLTLKLAPESFTSHLNSLNFTYYLNKKETSKDAINLTADENGSFYNSVPMPTSPLTGTSIYTDSAKPEESGVTFAKNLNFTNMSLGLTLTASTKGSPPPFRIVIEAHDNVGKLVGSASADFKPKQ